MCAGIIKSTLTPIWRSVATWPFLVIHALYILRQLPPEVGITLMPHTALLERGQESSQDNFPSKKIVPHHLEEWFLMDTVPGQVGKVLTREKHSQPCARCWLRPPAYAECHTKCDTIPSNEMAQLHFQGWLMAGQYCNCETLTSTR